MTQLHTVYEHPTTQHHMIVAVTLVIPALNEVQAGELKFKAILGYREFEVSLGYMSPHLKNKQTSRQRDKKKYLMVIYRLVG